MLIVGLGNIGAEYEGTFHNTGFMVADALAERLGLSFKDAPTLSARMAEGNVGGKKVRILKPTTYMNLSGVSVKSAMTKFELGAKDVIVIYDDIDLPVGVTRYREKGSAGTHNGMRNITSLCGELPRLRVGIGRPHEQEDLASYVLKKAGKEAREALSAAADHAAEAIENYIRGGDEAAFSREMNTQKQ